MLRYVGYLRPDNESLFVAKIVEILIVLIVSETYGGGTDLHYEVDILSVMLGKKRVTDAPSVLVAGYAAQRILLAVQDKSELGINAIGAATEAGAYVVYYSSVLDKLELGGVEIGILPATPEDNVLDIERDPCIGALAGRDHASHLTFYGIADGLSRLHIRNVCLDLYVSVLSVNLGGDLKTGGTEIVKVEVRLVNAYYVHVTVKSAVEGEVCNLGIYPVVRRVIHRDNDERLAAEALGDIDSEGRIAAVVVSEVLAAYVYVSGGVCASYLEIILLCLGKVHFIELFCIEAGAAIVVISAVLTVNGIPRMGEIDKIPVRGDLGGDSVVLSFRERPFSVEINDISH